ncbi:unnamed protein product [Nezara viridula]|uniref:Cytochrome P450 n=1 Tax=Nezara viridula TaxID=85310 RepID=A0A9P0H9Y2_NEZVI|nr:unnamed protein product [Nezara viridula]
MLGLITSLICLVFVAAYIFLKRRYTYWKMLGVAGPEPTMVVGNMKHIISLKFSEPDMMNGWYKEYKNEPYIGYYNFWKPTLFVIDPELIKAITETDFNHFTDHPNFTTETETDAILDSLFDMKGARWKAKRQIFSKLFSPKKQRELSNILEEHHDSLLVEVEEQRKSKDEVELMGIMERHILKILTSFMYSIDSSQNRERHSKLSELSEIFARPPGSSVRRFLFFIVFPSLYQKLRISAFPSIFWNYFSNFTNELLHSRNDKGDRDDLVALIAKMQKEGLLESERIEYNEAVGHVFSFLIAGHHTTMTTLSHVIYQLSLHPQIQEKLRTEVDSVLKGKDTVTYDSIRQMNYLDGVINGKRFAYISMKTVIAKIISEYIILPGTKTRNPLVFDTRTFFITVHPIDGLHVRIQKRMK